MAEKKSKKVRGEQRTTKEDWLRTALDTLISEGVDAVKVSVLAQKLDCARSSFYWYFNDRRDILDQLLEYWRDRNTRAILEQANREADTVNLSLINLFSCWVSSSETGPRKFDTRLDFAVREWARRDGSVRRALDISDDARISAIANMFERFGYKHSEAKIRAQIVYFTQIGYEALDVRQSNSERAAAGHHYLYCMTGVKPDDRELKAIQNLANEL